MITTPASQSIGTEIEEQDLTNHDPQPSNNYEMSTPSSASLVLENDIASTPASFVVNPCSASSCTSGASVVSKPLSTAYNCKECAHKARKKKHNLLRANKRLKMKVWTLKEEVSSLKLTITELESHLPVREMEREDEPEEQESSKQESEHPANYYVWSSTGNESEDEYDNKDDAWGPGGIRTKDEGTTEDEEEIQEDQNYIHVDPTAPDYTYNQPKFIVYYEMLCKLFLLLCFNCKAENTQVTMRQNGTMVTVMQQCRKCKGFFWNSQSYMPHMWQTSCG